MAFVAPFQAPFTKVFPQATSAAAFTPNSLSPAWWYAFRDISSLYTDSGGTTPVAADGDPIGFANDLSTNNRDIAQGTTSAKPTYKVNIKNGLSVASYDGGDVLAKSALSTGDFTYFSVFYRANTSAHGFFGDTAAGYGLRVAATGAVRLNTSTANTALTASSALVGTTWYIMAVTRSSGALKCYINNVDATSGSPSNATAFDYTQLGDNGAAGVPYNGYRGEDILFPTLLSAGELTSMWTYLNTIWAVY